MPELPEVETVRRSLEPRIVGRRIVGVSPGDFPGVMGPGGLERSDLLVGRVINAIRRRGKYLLLGLDDCTQIIIHLRMTGQLVLTAPDAPPLRFQRLAIHLSTGPDQRADESGDDLPSDEPVDLRFADQRKFGRVVHATSEQATSALSALGPEPLGSAFTPEVLGASLAARRAPIKSVLLDQRGIAGLGNIYVDEALFRAGIHPLRPAGSVPIDQVAVLHAAIVDVLERSLAHRGTTFNSFVDSYGMRGDNAAELNVYGRGRAGLPCRVCGTALQTVRVAGRTSSFCPQCQPLPTPDFDGGKRKPGAAWRDSGLRPQSEMLTREKT